jgi:hypothetical protein
LHHPDSEAINFRFGIKGGRLEEENDLFPGVLGAAIGAGTGLVGGYLYGKHKESEQTAYERGVNDGRQAR